MQRISLVFIHLFFSILAIGQLPYTYYGPGQGLSDNLVTGIKKDSIGFVWLATSNGLNRFDGYTFQTFGPGTPRPGRLSGRYISRMDWTHDQKLLLVYQNNIDFFELFNPKTFAVEKVNLYPANGVQGNVRFIKASAGGQVYVLSELIDATHIYQYCSQDTLALVAELPHPSDQLREINDFVPLPNGEFLISDQYQGLFHLDQRGQQHAINPAPILTKESPDAGIPSTAIFQYSAYHDLTFISLEGVSQLFAYDAGSKTLLPYDIPGTDPQKEFTYLWEDKKGNLLVSQTNGAGTYPISERIFFLPLRQPAKDWTFLTQVTKYIVSLYADDFTEILFFGADTGLKIHYNTRLRQENFLSQSLAPDEFGAVMRGITSDRDSSVFLTREYRYWYKLNELTGKLDTLPIRRAPNAPPIDFKCSFDVLYTAPNTLWGIACEGDDKGLLIRYDIDTELAQTFTYETRFQDLILSQDEQIWLIANNQGGGNVLVQFDPVNESFREYTTSENTNPFQRYLLNCITQDQQGRLWIGTNRGLLRFAPQKDQLDIFTREEGLISNTIQVLTVNKEQELWVGTSEGITVLDSAGRFIRQYTTEQALCNNNVSAIVEDHLGNIWVSTSNGLSVLGPDSEEFRSYYFTDGFPSDNFINNSALMSQNGYLYLGTVNGFTRFRPEDLLLQIDLPAPQFSTIERYDIETDSSIIDCYTTCPQDIIQLQPGDDYLDLSFFLPYYQAPQKNTFRIKMMPLESEWNELRQQNTYRYQRLPPGKYTVLLQAGAPSGQWSSQTTRLTVNVLPHWYETTWAYVALVGLMVFLAYIIFQYRLRQKLNVARLRTKISSDIHDEVSGLLSGIAMQSDLLQESTNDPQQRDRLKNIGNVSRKAVSQIHDVIWSIDSRKDHMEDLIKRMREHAEDVLLPHDITFDIRHTNVDPRKRLPVIVRQNIFFIFKEAINNVAKHSNATRVTIQLVRQKPIFIMTIQDNGTRMPAPGARHGQGLDNMHMRAKRIRGKLTIQFAQGCVVKLELPRL